MTPSQLTAHGGQSAGTAETARSHAGLGTSAADALNFGEDTRPGFVAARMGATCKGGVHLCSW